MVVVVQVQAVCDCVAATEDSSDVVCVCAWRRAYVVCVYMHSWVCVGDVYCSVEASPRVFHFRLVRVNL